MIRFLLFLYIAPYLKLVARAELPFPKSALRAEEIKNPISKSVKTQQYHKKHQTDRTLLQISNANLVVG